MLTDSQMEPSLLRLEDVLVDFGAFKLDIDSFRLPRFGIEVVIGGNGAGKTTLCDSISGRTKIHKGTITFDDTVISGKSESEIASLGIGRKFQTPTVFNNLTVFENMSLVLPGSGGLLRSLRLGPSMNETERICRMLDKVDLTKERDRLAGTLSHGQRQWLELAMLTLTGSKLLLVDEPAAGLTPAEVARTVKLLKELGREHSVMVIEHNMDFVAALEAPVTFLDRGAILLRGSFSEVQAHPDAHAAYWGTRRHETKEDSHA